MGFLTAGVLQRFALIVVSLGLFWVDYAIFRVFAPETLNLFEECSLIKAGV